MRTLAAAVALAAVCAAPAGAAPQPQPPTWNFAQIRIGGSQDAGHGGAGVVVAVADTWIETTHPEFSGRMLTGADCAGGTCKPGNAAPDGCDAHGTHVAGTVASTSYGVAPSARILPIRILKWNGSECVGTSGDLGRAIRYAMAHGARVVNVSAGAAVPLAQHDDTLDAAVADAAAAGVLVVFAAGNQNLPVADSYGGNALIVAATGRSGAIASYSQHGTGVDLAAPGGDPPGDTCTEQDCVVSTWSNKRYAALAGTSMAAPHVSGIAALLFAQKARTRDDVIARLRNTAHPLAGAGSGLVDASAALGASSAPPTATAPPTHAPVVRLPPRTAPPRVVPKPTPKPTRKPTPKPTPRPSRTARPAPSPTATVTEPPPQAAAPLTGRDPARTVPVGLAVALLLGTGAGTVTLARRPQL